MKKKYLAIVFRVSRCNVILLSTEPLSALDVFILRVQQCISFVAMIRNTSFLQKTGAITIMLFVGTFSIIPCIQLNIFAICNDAVFNDRMMHIATDSFRIAYVLFILHSHNLVCGNTSYLKYQVHRIIFTSFILLPESKLHNLFCAILCYLIDN